ncbi:MAG: glycosyltransferase family 2 protein [Muribaculaceae bacterium]|nr:glycosyltransferase family 2 protein [Muribaculaceae bacterium]
MKIQVLISCMHQKDRSIIYRSNVQCDVLVINQCDENKYEEFTFINKSGQPCKATFISTTERGLSRSRNLAIKHATGDICVICDDDQEFVDNLEEIITEAYISYPLTSVMLFALKWDESSKVYPTITSLLTYKSILKSSSPQITFRRQAILDSGVLFDEKMGSGTGNGGGEENKFLFDCKRIHLNLRYYPKRIATINSSPSQWFKGYTPEFIRNLGWSTRRSQGNLLGLIYSVYWIIAKHYRYKQNFGYISALKYILQGYGSKR